MLPKLWYWLLHLNTVSCNKIFIFVVPKVQFKEGSYKVDESDEEIKAIVYRSGDISLRSTVRCYTRQGSAQVMMDYSERPNTDASIITFLPGESCLLNPVFLHLLQPFSKCTDCFSRWNWEALCG